MIGAIHLSTIRRWRYNPEDDVTEMFGRAARFAAESIGTTRSADAGSH